MIKIDKSLIKDLFNYLQPYCIAIYLGGSACQEYIENIHDIDFICFVDEPVNMCHIRRLIDWYKRKQKVPENYDFIQIRTKQQEEHSYGSYINKMMIKLIGEDLEFKFDVIDKDKVEYIKILKDAVDKLISGKIINQKRWYQIYQGLCIMKNKSYILTTEQIKNLNILHDEKEGSKEIIENIIVEVNSWQII